MRIDAAKAEAVDGGTARHICGAALPGLALPEYLERAAVERNLPGGLFEVRHRRQLAVLHREQCLDQAGAARGRKQVTDVRLHGAQDALGLFPVAALPEPGQALELDRVAYRGAGGVALDQVHHLRRPAGLRVRHLQGAQLAL